MLTMPETIAYAWSEHLGNIALFVGRKKEFDCFLTKPGDRFASYIVQISVSMISFPKRACHLLRLQTKRLVP